MRFSGFSATDHYPGRPRTIGDFERESVSERERFATEVAPSL
jgi:hypothetical protein